MSTGGKVASAATAACVLGAGWWLGNHSSSDATGTVTVSPPSQATTNASASSASSASTSDASTPSASTSSTKTSTAGTSGTYVGSTESDRYGDLTVTVTMSNGKITDVTYTSTARDGRSLSIEAMATPTLKSEAIAANSADIDAVSGATYTSAKYKASLQAALDQA